MVCALTSKVEQLVLIGMTIGVFLIFYVERCLHFLNLLGDHYQLRPSVGAYHLAHMYNHDVSLFERLIGLGINPVQLTVQYRMRVEISRLITTPIYPNLENHSSVFSRPHISGMGRDVYFYDHTCPETIEGTGYSNKHEALMALGLALYLCQGQRVPVSKVTILTTYSAQMLLISKILKQPKWHPLKDLRVVVVDNFQVFCEILNSGQF